MRFALCLSLLRRPLTSTLFPYTTLFRSHFGRCHGVAEVPAHHLAAARLGELGGAVGDRDRLAAVVRRRVVDDARRPLDRKSTRLNSSHVEISYAVFCLKKKITEHGFLNR